MLVWWFIRVSCSPGVFLLIPSPYTTTLLPTLPSACVAAASYCNSWPLPSLFLLIFAMYVRRVIFHTLQEGSSSAEELISSCTGNFVAKQGVEWGFPRLRWHPNLLAVTLKPYFVSTESFRDFKLNPMPLFFHNMCYLPTLFFPLLPPEIIRLFSLRTNLQPPT